MNKQRRQILLAYVVFLSVIALCSFIIVGYAIYEKHIASFSDVFHKVTDTEEAAWIQLAVVALANLFVFSSIIFVGILMFIKKKGNP